MGNENNTIVFRLAVSCEEKKEIFENKKIFSNSLNWLPCGSEIPQETNCYFSSTNKELKLTELIQPVDPNILLAVLAPGQEIILEAHCNKGIGSLHAKWSPVATQWYLFKSEAILLQKVQG